MSMSIVFSKIKTPNAISSFLNTEIKKKKILNIQKQQVLFAL